MKQLRLALGSFVGLVGSVCADVGVVAVGDAPTVGSSLLVGKLEGYGKLVLDAPTTLRRISRGYFPESGVVRSRFIRRVAAANSHIFRNAELAFDQLLPAGQSLNVPLGLLPSLSELDQRRPERLSGQSAQQSSTVVSAPSKEASAADVVQTENAERVDAAKSAASKVMNLSLPHFASGESVPGARRVSLKSFASMIVNSDELVRAQRLEENIADESVRGAQGIFEPFMFVALEREGMYVLSSAQDAQKRGSVPGDIFSSRESRLKTGVTLKAPVGTDIEVSYNVSSLRDSIQPTKLPVTSPEQKGYMGVKITQPLWRGAGSDATRIGIAIAETEKDVAKETVRQLMAQRVMDGLNSYIFVQRAEERVRLRTLALEAASEIEREMMQQNVAGLRSASELTEARSSLALRRVQLAQAQQDMEEQQNSLQVFVSASEEAVNIPLAGSLLRPADPLVLAVDPSFSAKDTERSFTERLDSVVMRRPESRVNAIRIEREGRKLKAARDQMLPEFNFTLRMGKEDLSNFTRPWTEYLTNNVPYKSWMMGFTFKVGLFDDEKKTSEYRTAAYRRQQAELALGAVRQRIANEVQASGSVLDKALQQVERQKEIVEAQKSLLKVEYELVREGRRSMLDVMKKLLEKLMADEALVDAVAQANRASYLASQVEGVLLSRLGLE